MEFGVFHEFPSLPGRSQEESFSSALAVVDRAEQLGIDAIWLAELHFAPERSLLASPLIVAAAVAQRTTRIRIGIAVQVLPLCHPLRLAEEAATVDQLSRGRLIFGVGRSGVVATYDALAVPYHESRDRFQEALEVIRLAWSEERVAYRGRFYQFEDVRLAPRPFQRPHPPIRVAASTSDTYALIGAMGLPMFVSARTVPWSELGPGIGRYRDAYAAAGHAGAGEVFVSVPVYLAASDERAEAEFERSMMSFYRYQAALQADSAARTGAERKDGAARAERAGRLANLAYRDALKAHLIVGTPRSAADQIRFRAAELGLAGILCEVNCGGLLPEPQVLNSMEFLAREVMPRFR